MNESLFLFLFICGLPILHIISLIWGYLDGQKRGKPGLAVAGLIFFLPIVGIISWILIRPSVNDVRKSLYDRDELF